MYIHVDMETGETYIVKKKKKISLRIFSYGGLDN